MKREHLDQAVAISKQVEAHEDFISNCDYFIRNIQPNNVPVVDRWLELAILDGVLNAEELKMLFVDLRDVVTQRLEDLDKKLEAL